MQPQQVPVKTEEQEEKKEKYPLPVPCPSWQGIHPACVLLFSMDRLQDLEASMA